MKPHVEQLSANSFIIFTPNGRFLQSYGVLIATQVDDQITLDSHYWDYSKTTGKARNAFLHEDKKTTQTKISSGEYKLENLNA